MATYFHGSSEFQASADGMQTLYLMNPNNYVPYSDTNQQQQAAATNMFFLNPTTSLPHAPPQPNRPLPLHGIVPGFHSNLWGASSSSLDHQNSPGGGGGGSSSHPPHMVVSAADNNNSGGSHDVVASSQSGFRRPMVSPRQGLSLSLSSQQQVPYRSSNNVETNIHGQLVNDHVRISGNSPSSVSVVSNGIPGDHGAVLGSKYLRAAQELLDEVVNVGKGIKTDVSEGTKEKIKSNKESVAAVTGEGSSGAGETGDKRGAELTTAQRQELQMKKAKLVNMLDEVEQRYRQYHHQMQVVVTSFEQAAGSGAAKSYTALALKTISKQFRCLKDAISEQIKATSKSLGEDDCLGAKVEGSRLRYVDHQLRQQRALQQLGMVQHNAWRPQRGLPERAVSVLRAWLFEHFLHPYPKDSDKHLLAKQTGLTRSQVSNWFINARVRLWKPMVEEMYLEEVKEQEKINGGSTEMNTNESVQKESGCSSNAGQQESVSIMMDQIKTQSQPNQNVSPTEFSNSTISTSPMGGSFLPQTGFNLIGSSELDGVAQRSPKKPRGSINDLQNSPSSILSMDMEMKQGETREFSMNFNDMGADHHHNPGSGFASYGPIGGDIGRFDPNQLTPRFHGNGVSLTLGLPHCENLSSLSGSHQNLMSNQNIQLGRRLELGPNEADFCGINNTQQASHSTTFDMQNRKRFAAQLLPDFVA